MAALPQEDGCSFFVCCSWFQWWCVATLLLLLLTCSCGAVPVVLQQTLRRRH